MKYNLPQKQRNFQLKGEKKNSILQNENGRFNLSKKTIIFLVIILIIAILIFIYFFSQNGNKKLNLGNNLSNKSNQEIEEYILNISSYEADIVMTVESNKTTTQYKLRQSYTSPNLEKQVVEEPSNIQGLETIYDGTKLTIKNTKLNLSTVYENYSYLTDNFLWLNSFIEDYKLAKKNGKNYQIYEENNKVIMTVKLESSNPYASYKQLFIDKQNGKIEKLIVQDKNQKNLVYILYNEIKINSLEKEEVLAFKLR